MGFKTDTIATISTAMTNSGIGIVRLSGEDAFSIIDKIYKGKDRSFCPNKKPYHSLWLYHGRRSRRLMKCWFF